jgi:ADP-ribose pyrophosphatase YjhB (NUDIX family)
MWTAPEHVRFCLRCGAHMVTREVAGVPRRHCPRCDYVHYADPKVAVGVAVFRADRLLLVRRTMNPGRGLWSLPGGYLDVGEDPRVAAVREAAEEASVDVRVTALLDVFANPPDDGGAVFVLYAATWVAGEPEPGDDADAAGFFARHELPPLAFRSTAHIVDRWRQTGPDQWQTDRP